MKFCWTTIGVKNMEESVKFYRDIVGLPVGRRFKTEEGAEICFLGEGETKVELVCGARYQAAAAPEGIALGFEVKSLDDMLEFVSEKELEIVGGPYQPNQHVKFFYIKDPDGVRVQFVENIK
jgi:lactoylglutathione lyase